MEFCPLVTYIYKKKKINTYMNTENIFETIMKLLLFIVQKDRKAERQEDRKTKKDRKNWKENEELPKQLNELKTNFRDESWEI